MANKKFWVGMLAIVLVFGITGIAYAQGGGTLTITDIPSRFNGMYAFFEGRIRANGAPLFGAQSFVPGGRSFVNRTTITAARINNGRVSIPVWNAHGSRYNGNHRVEILVDIGSPASLDYFVGIANIEFNSVSFTNGSATVSIRDGDFSE